MLLVIQYFVVVVVVVVVFSPCVFLFDCLGWLVCVLAYSYM